MAFTIAAAVTGVVAGAGIAQIAVLTTTVTNLIDHLNENHHPLEKNYEFNLSISEAFTLIWLDHGETASGLPLQRARQACLLAAEFLDLVAQNRIQIERAPSNKQKKQEKQQEQHHQTDSPQVGGHKGKAIVKIVDKTPTNSHLDKLLKKIADKEKPQSLRKWILTEHIHGDWVTPVLDHMTEKKVLIKGNWQLSNKTRQDLRDRLRAVALNQAQGTGNLYALLGVIYCTDDFIGASLMSRLFSKEENEHAKNNLNLMVVAKKT